MTTAAETRPETREEFFEAVAQSGVLEEDLFVRWISGVPIELNAAEDVADLLVSRGAITRFQADRLLQGQIRGFTVDSYIIEDYLAKPEHGRVYLARHRTMKRTVCLVVLNPELTNTEPAREAIRNAARTVAQLMHPNLVTLFDANIHKDRMYFVEEFMPGTDLESYQRSNGRLKWPMACSFVHQGAQGLGHAHERGIIHGVLRPAHILIGSTPPGRPAPVKVAGLGLVPTSPFAGGFDGLAPEIFDGDAATAAADVYALGTILYRTLAGKSPFSCPNREAAQRQHATATPVPLSTIRADIPLPISALVDAMLVKKRTDRPTMDSVAKALAPFADESLEAAFEFGVHPESLGSSGSSFSSGMTELQVALPPSDPWADIAAPAEFEVETSEYSGISTPTPITTRNRRRIQPEARGLPIGVLIACAMAFFVLLVAVAAVAMALRK